MRSRRATAICRGPTSRPSARRRGICISAGTCGHPCTAARRSERFSTLMNGSCGGGYSPLSPRRLWAAAERRWIRTLAGKLKEAIIDNDQHHSHVPLCRACLGLFVRLN